MRFLFFLTLIFVFAASISKGQTLIGREVLGRPTSESINIRAIFDTIVEVRVQYGTTSGTYANQTSWQLFNQDTSNEAVATIELTSLTANTKYYYMLQYRLQGGTAVIDRPEYCFHTGRAIGETFTFTVEADPHMDYNTDTALLRLCMQNILDDNPDFMFDLGDNFMTEKLKNLGGVVPIDTIPYRCKLLRSYYETACHSVPLFLVMGNHEGEAGWYNNGTANNIAVWNTNIRKKYYSNPVPDNFYSGDTTTYNFIGKREAYYSFEWGNALFVILDPYWYTTPKPDSLNCWRWTLGKTQYDWLKATLENSTSDFKFVFAHQIVGANKEGRGGAEMAEGYEWGGLNIDSTDGWAAHRPNWYKPIKELLEENRVTIFFHGHDHLYVKQDLNCLVYQEVPQPGLPNFMGTQTALTYGYVNGIIKPNSGHLRLTVSATNVNVEYVRVIRPSQETGSLHNKDILHSYQIGLINCYDSLTDLQQNISETISAEASPNPFNDQTTLKYSLEKDNFVSVRILDMLGNEITTLVNQEQKAGKYSINIDPDIMNLKQGIFCCIVNIGRESRNIKLVHY